MTRHPREEHPINPQDVFAYFLMAVSAICLIAAIVFVVRQFTGETEFKWGDKTLKTSVVGVAFLAGSIGFALIGYLLLTNDGGEDNGGTTTVSPPTTSNNAPTTGQPLTTTPSSDTTSAGPSDATWDAGQSGSDSGLTITVTQVRREGDGTFTLLTTVENDTDDSISLPLFGGFLATDDTGSTSGADPFASDWPQGSIAPGRTITGEIRLDRRLSADGTSFSVDFQVFGSFAVDDVQIEGIPIR